MRWTNVTCGVLMLVGPNALAQGALGDTPTRAEGAAPVDEERARALESRLASDPVLRDDKVSIEVSGKRVRLSGIVDDEDQRAHAEEVVRQSDPTLTVENLLQTNTPKTAPPAPSEDDKATAAAKRAGHEAKKVATEAGAMIDDSWITSKIKAQLMAADGVHASHIDVDTTDHVVTLKGHVQSRAERKRVMDIVWKTHGVDRVVDQMTMAGK